MPAGGGRRAAVGEQTPAPARARAWLRRRVERRRPRRSQVRQRPLCRTNGSSQPRPNGSGVPPITAEVFVVTTRLSEPFGPLRASLCSELDLHRRSCRSPTRSRTRTPAAARSNVACRRDALNESAVTSHSSPRPTTNGPDAGREPPDQIRQRCLIRGLLDRFPGSRCRPRSNSRTTQASAKIADRPIGPESRHPNDARLPRAALQMSGPEAPGTRAASNPDSQRSGPWACCSTFPLRLLFNAPISSMSVAAAAAGSEGPPRRFSHLCVILLSARV